MGRKQTQRSCMIWFRSQSWSLQSHDVGNLVFGCCSFNQQPKIVAVGLSLYFLHGAWKCQVPIYNSAYPPSKHGPDALCSTVGEDERPDMYVPTESFTADQSFLFHLSERGFAFNN